MVSWLRFYGSAVSIALDMGWAIYTGDEGRAVKMRIMRSSDYASSDRLLGQSSRNARPHPAPLRYANAIAVHGSSR